jgi:phenylalanyl-tRNA synthetase alpha chain
MHSLIESIQHYQQNIEDIANVFMDHDALALLRHQWLGKQGILKLIQHDFLKCSSTEKIKVGPMWQHLQKTVRAVFQQSPVITEPALPAVDVTVPLSVQLGRQHPTTALIQHALRFFEARGFCIWNAPERDTSDYNFTFLGVPSDHPARNASDTFYLTDGWLLRTHTSNAQMHFLENMPHNIPMHMVSVGKAYRKDSDATHTPMFHQLEALLIGQYGLPTLQHIIQEFLNHVLSSPVKLRFRRSYFPFTAPSLEVDLQCIHCQTGCSICKQTRWLEILGCGCVHPGILHRFNLSNHYGIALGCGIERLLMLTTSLKDMRDLYSS